MGKYRGSVLIFGMLIIIIAASLLTVLLLYAAGVIATAPIELTYKIENAEKYYDGTPLKATDYELVSGELKSGHAAVAEITGEQTEAGTGFSGLSLKVYDERNFDVTGEYAVKVEGGLLTVNPAPLNVLLNDNQVVYNGGKVIFDNYTVLSGNLVGGHKIGGSADAELMDAGERLPADLTPVVYDVWGRDVSANYSITFTRGDISIAPRPLSLKPVDMKKTYDGAPLTCTEYEILSGSLVDGHVAKVEINDGEATITDVETFRAIITDVKIYAADGKDVTANYDIDYASTSLLVIEPRPLTVTAKSGKWTFDGLEHSFEEDGAPLSVSGLAANDEIYSVSYRGSVRDVGSEINEITNVSLSAEEKNYDITLVNGTLEVTAFNLTVYCKTLNKVYDGEPLSNASTDGRIYDLSPALPDYFDFYYYSGGVENKTDAQAGSFVLTDISILFNGGECTENFEISVISGSYNIAKRTVSVPLESFTLTYDGNVFTPALADAFANVALPEPLDINSFRLVSYTQMKNADEYVYSANLIDADSAKNYDLQISDGRVVIEKRAVTLTYSGGNIEKTYDGLPAKALASDFALDGFKVGNVELDRQVVYVADSGIVKVSRVAAYDIGGADVTENLNIDYSGAQVNVIITPRPVTVTILDVTYNGDDYPARLSEDILSGKAIISTATPLAEGNQANIELIYSSSSHRISVDTFIIVGADGRDVSANYSWTNEDVYTILTLVKNG